MSRVQINGLVDAAALRRIADAVRLPIMVHADAVDRVATELSAVLMRYALASSGPPQPKLAEATARAQAVAKHARELLTLLDADRPGLDGALPSYVPVPGWLIADPAGPVLREAAAKGNADGRVVPTGEWDAALDTSERRGDAARDSMLAEAGARLDTRSIFGAHDVVRLSVAALRQLAALADTAGDRNAMIRRTALDLPTVELFSAFAEVFGVLHDRKYTVSNRAMISNRATAKGRESQPSGPAMRWTRALLKHAAEESQGARTTEALRKLAAWGEKKPDGLAARIRAAGAFIKRVSEQKAHPKRRQKRRQIYCLKNGA